MKEEKDIFERMGKPSQGVPEGYFDDLKARLGAIPSGRAAGPSPWMRMKPYIALAACFAAALVVGNSILWNTTLKYRTADQYYNEIAYADIISLSQAEALLMAMDSEQEDLSDEDIINYLIESGVPTEQIAYEGTPK